jgi:hypothetical protein
MFPKVSLKEPVLGVGEVGVWFVFIYLYLLFLCRNLFIRLSVMVHACNTSCSGSGDKRITVQDQPGKKVSKTLSQKQTGCDDSRL